MHPAWYINGALGVLLQSLLFWRAFRFSLWRHYPFFYSYLACTTAQSLILTPTLISRQSIYSKVYWWSHALAAIFRLGIAAEVYRYTFARNSPLRRRAG